MTAQIPFFFQSTYMICRRFRTLKTKIVGDFPVGGYDFFFAPEFMEEIQDFRLPGC